MRQMDSTLTWYLLQWNQARLHLHSTHVCDISDKDKRSFQVGSDRGIDVPSWRRGSEGMTSTKQPLVFTPARASSMHSLVTPNTDVRYPELETNAGL